MITFRFQGIPWNHHKLYPASHISSWTPEITYNFGINQDNLMYIYLILTDFSVIKTLSKFDLCHRNTWVAGFCQSYKLFQKFRRKCEMQDRVYDDFMEFLESKCDHHKLYYLLGQRKYYLLEWCHFLSQVYKFLLLTLVCITEKSN